MGNNWSLVNEPVTESVIQDTIEAAIEATAESTIVDSGDNANSDSDDDYDDSDAGSDLTDDEAENQSAADLLTKLKAHFDSLSDSEDTLSKRVPPYSSEQLCWERRIPAEAMDTDDILQELIQKQLPNVPSQWKMNIYDMRRIRKYLPVSIFSTTDCCIWDGYITNLNNCSKGTYINFYFRNKKTPLHRLLYSNYVAPLTSDQYLKFTCNNKGKCCNINHLEKYSHINQP